MVKSVLLIDEDPLTLFISSKIIEIAAPHVRLVTFTNIRELSGLFDDYVHHGNYPDLILASFNKPAAYDTNYLDLLAYISIYTKVVALGVFLENDIKLFKKYSICDYVAIPLSVSKIEEIIHY